MILATGFERADPIVSLLIAGVMIRSGSALVKASARILLEAAPKASTRARSAEHWPASPASSRRDLHVWEVTSGFPARSAHVPVNTEADCHATRRTMDMLFHDHFHIEHTTLQVDHQGSDLLDIQALWRDIDAG